MAFTLWVRSRAHQEFASGTDPSRSRSAAAAVEQLEGRALMSTTGGTFTSTPEDDIVLRPEMSFVNDSAPTASSGARALTQAGFQIEVVFPDDTLTASQKSVFTAAAARGQSILLGDLPNVTSDFDGDGIAETIDDVRITASGPAIDGVGKILGQAGPEYIRTSNDLPITGMMEFDSADLADLEAGGQLDEVILHEMGHVLGLGTLWTDRGLISGAGGTDPRYTGTLGNAQYRAIFGLSGSDTIPIENSGSAGTRDGHWREATFANELMTGYLDNGVVPLSRMTIAQYADMGYPSVNINGFDAYTNPGGGGNAYPTISSLSGGNEAAMVNSSFTLTANGATDANGSVASVRFYRETNGIPGLQVLTGTGGDMPGDIAVSTDSMPTDGFSATVSTSGLTAGTTYTYYAQATDNQNLVSVNVSTTKTVVTSAPIVTPPILSSIVVNDGAAQRSQVTRLTLNFDRPVSVSAGAATLVRLNTGGSGSNDGSAPSDASDALGAPTTSDGGRSWSYPLAAGSAFVQTASDGTLTSLVDGAYTLTVDSLKVTADGVPMLIGGSATFHRLFGDLNGDAVVNPLDYSQFRNAFGTGADDAAYNAAFDFDGNGVINPLDYNQFRIRFGTGFSY